MDEYSVVLSTQIFSSRSNDIIVGDEPIKDITQEVVDAIKEAIR